MGMRTTICGSVTWKDTESRETARNLAHRISDYYDGSNCTIFDSFLEPEDYMHRDQRCVGRYGEFKDYENQCSQFADIVIKYAVAADLFAVDDYDRGGCLVIDAGAIVRRGCFEPVEDDNGR